jgi:hypothetical protein
MRKQMGIVGISMLLIVLCFSGCDEIGTKPDSVTVNVMAAAYVKMVDADNTMMNISVDGISVSFEMTKKGDDRLVFDRIVQGGLCQATCSYTLSKGEWINCTATVQGGYQGYYPVAPVSVHLSWDTVNASRNFGAMYHWYPELTITMKKS